MFIVERMNEMESEAMPRGLPRKVNAAYRFFNGDYTHETLISI
jgi:hypothetical protein